MAQTRALLAHLVVIIGPQGHRRGTGSVEVRVIPTLTWRRRLGQPSAWGGVRGLLPVAKGRITSKYPTGLNPRWSLHTPEGNRALGQTLSF